MASVPSYQALKKKVQDVQKFNVKEFKRAVKLCHAGRDLSENMARTNGGNESILDRCVVDANKALAKWRLTAEVLIDLQADLKAAKRKKDKLAIKELTSKITFADKEARKHMETANNFHVQSELAAFKIDKVGKALKKI